MAIAPFNTTTAANIWQNADGLTVKFGVTEGRIDHAGEYEDVVGGLSVTEIRINATEISTVSATLLGTGNASGLPANAIIDHIDVFPEIVCTGTGAVLNLGLATTADHTVVSATALIAGQILSTLTPAGTRTVHSVGTTYAGTKMGITVGTLPTVFTIDNGGTAYTAGKIVIRIFSYVPDAQVGGE